MKEKNQKIIKYLMIIKLKKIQFKKSNEALNKKEKIITKNENIGSKKNKNNKNKNKRKNNKYNPNKRNNKNNHNKKNTNKKKLR